MAGRLLTINIRNYLSTQPRRKRHMRVSRYVKEKISGAVKVEEKNVRISKELNSIIIKEYVRSMKPLKLNINVDKGIATATPFSEKPAAPGPKEEGKPAQKAAPKESDAKPKAESKK